MKYTLLLPFLSFLFFYNCNAESNFLHLRKETIYIKNNLSNFQSVVEYYGTTKTKLEFVNILSGSLEKITDCKIGTLRKNNSYKYQNSDNFFEHGIDNGTFYSGLKIQSHQIDKNSKFAFTYKKTCNESMLFSILPFFDYNKVDTFEYIVHIPKGINYKFDFVNQYLLTQCKYDSTVTGDETIYHFLGVYTNNGKSIFNGLIHKKKPLIRLILTPENYTGKESEYINQWYLELAKTQSILNEKTIKIIKEITKNSLNKDSIISSLFKFTQKNIKYLDIEDGINAHRPQDANLVMEDRQGDCKGKANLLCQSLIYNNIDARLALVGTTTNICNFDFPSLVSANHAICAVFHNNRWMFLDPTDPTCLLGNPSSAIQGRTIFITGSEGGIYKYVEPIDTSTNKTIIELSLSYDNNKLAGDFSYTFKGEDSYDIKNNYVNKDSITFNKFLKEFLSEISPNIKYNEFKTKVINDTVIIVGSLEINDNSFTKTSEKHYLNLNFIPDLISAPIKLQADEYVISHASNIICQVNFKFPNKVKLITKPENFTLAQNNYSISHHFSEKADDFTLNYQFINRNTILDSDIIKSYNEIYNIIRKKIKPVLCFTY